MQGRSKDVVRESVYMSNVAPVYPALDRRLWMNLEAQVRKWTKKYGRVYVISGPIFKGEPTWMTPVKPGVEGKVAIPTHLYKIVYRKTGDDLFGLAFVVPNQEERFDSDRDFGPWQVTIRDVEDWTGLDFLSRLPHEVEHRLETTKEEIWE
jgi:endonuclease G